MTKQEEIREDAIIITKDQMWREGIRDEQRLAVGAIQIVDGIFSRLHSKGVVINVERELPDVTQYTHPHWHDHCFAPKKLSEYRKDMAGYVAVEPLIEEE